MQPDPTPNWHSVLDALEAHLDARDALLDQRAASGATTSTPSSADLPASMPTPTPSEHLRARALAARIETQLATLSEAIGDVRGELDRVASHRRFPAPRTVGSSTPSRLDRHA